MKKLFVCIAFAIAFMAVGCSKDDVGTSEPNNDGIAISSIKLNRTSITISVGTSVILTAKLSPDNANNQSVKWSSSNTSVATVYEGTVTAVSNGTANITAQVGNVKAECSVTVCTNGEGESGIYFGIMGFNDSVYPYPISILTAENRAGFDSFINGLTMKNGTLLYYSVDQAINTMQSISLPSDISKVAIVTFTDGIDQGSTMLNSQYDEDEYLDMLNRRILNETVSNQPITSYTVGLRGNDANMNESLFEKNITKLASSPDKASIQGSMDGVNTEFIEIAKELSQSSYIQTLNIKIPGKSNGTRFRFTFDNVDSATKSTHYIEGVFNTTTYSLDNVIYEGLTSTSGISVRGDVNGIFVSFTFEGVQTDNNILIDKNFIDEWYKSTSDIEWNHNDEIDKDEFFHIETKRSSAVVMLVLDCSSSLGDKFTQAQTNAKNFINTLYDAVGTGLDIDIPDNIGQAFPDPNFRQYVLENIDADCDGKLSKEECAAVIYMQVSSKGIKFLDGIEYFKNLTYLDCSNNQLTSLDVSQNTALTNLDCRSNNHLTSLRVLKNTALTNLNCDYNNLTTLDVSQNTALTDLYCNGNQLTSLDVSQNTALTTLWCGTNQLTSLDVSQNTALTHLYCYSNQLTTLDVSQNTALTVLSCDYNHLMSLDVSQNTALIHLYCDSNQLTTLDVSHNTALIYLSCGKNQLTNLDLSKNTELTDLYFDNNQLTTLDISKNMELDHLGCGSNRLTTLDVSGCAALTYLDCRDNQLTTLDVSNTNLDGGILYCAPMETLDVLYLKTGWEIPYITPNRDTRYIPEQTKIVFIDGDYGESGDAGDGLGGSDNDL